ncbi:hypothetical protein F5Y15DRAFT_204111 [Xylariaceae sp. FL0016]|nr:hypothetical protein F5Y15DRAFT_204111 [Xylariaceae sp. FL0016]
MRRYRRCDRTLTQSHRIAARELLLPVRLLASSSIPLLASSKQACLIDFQGISSYLTQALYRLSSTLSTSHVLSYWKALNPYYQYRLAASSTHPPILSFHSLHPPFRIRLSPTSPSTLYYSPVIASPRPVTIPDTPHTAYLLSGSRSRLGIVLREDSIYPTTPVHSSPRALFRYYLALHPPVHSCRNNIF